MKKEIDKIIKDVFWEADDLYIPIVEYVWDKNLRQRIHYIIRNNSKYRTVKILNQIYIKREHFLEILKDIQEKEKFKTN